jgi:hypothetical protein
MKEDAKFWDCFVERNRGAPRSLLELSKVRAKTLFMP